MRTLLKTLLATTIVAGLGPPAGTQEAFEGPRRGPAAAADKTIIVLAGDLKNGGILGITTGIEEAVEVTGWDIRVLDGARSVRGRTGAISQTLALQPDGIVINGFDAVERQAAFEAAVAAGIPMVAWHSGPKIGCDAPGGIFANVPTDAMAVSEVTAEWAMNDGGDTVGVVILTDSTYQTAIDKADRIQETIEAMGGTVLAYVDTLAIDDLYFDFMCPTLVFAGIPGDGAPKAGWAGDGTEAAFQRIRGQQYQAITVAEPLNLHGWQLMDELNHAIQGEPCSGYVSTSALVTTGGLQKMGDSNAFDPEVP